MSGSEDPQSPSYGIKLHARGHRWTPSLNALTTPMGALHMARLVHFTPGQNLIYYSQHTGMTQIVYKKGGVCKVFSPLRALSQAICIPPITHQLPANPMMQANAR